MTTILDFRAWFQAQVLPVPDEGKDKAFYDAWGYEQFMIKRLKQGWGDVEILYAPQYETYVLAAHLAQHGVGKLDTYLVGRPIVRARHALSRFPFSAAAKGWHGVDWFQMPDGRRYISFVAKTSATRLQSFCDPEEFEDTDLVYESAAQVSALDHGRHPVSPNSLAGEVCTVPGLNSERPLFVGQVYFCSMGHSWDCILHWIDAESLGRKKDGSFKRPTKAIMAAMRQARKDNVSATRFLAADKDRLEDAEVLAW